MSPDNVVFPNPKSHPDNANLPNINQEATILGTTVVFMSVALVAICLRLWVRMRDRLWSWDDAFVCLAAVASFVGNIMVCLMPKDGLGLHLWTLDNAHLMAYFKHIYTTNAAYSASATLIKLAILFQYLRLFAESASTSTSAQYRLARRLTWGLITLSAAWGLTFFLLALFSCNPIAKNWNPYLQGRCIGWGTKEPNEFFAMFLGHALSNAVLDALVLLLPVPFLTMLRLAGKSRAGLFTLFALGCIVMCVAIGRMIALSLNRAGTVPVLDMSYHTPAVFLFGVLELNIAIVAASIPIFYPVIATLASNKIFVVNEIEIHVEHVSRNDSFDSTGAISLHDRKKPRSSQKDKLGVVTTTTFDNPSRKSHEKRHSHKPSNASSMGRTMGLEFSSRPSQESQRYLYKLPSNDLREHRSSRSLTHSEADDWLAEIDKVNASGNTTTVQRTAIPFEHIKASDNV